MIILTALCVIGTFAGIVMAVGADEDTKGMKFMPIFYGILAFMFYVLACSPKDNPYILGRQSGLKKATFVWLCIAGVFASTMYSAITEQKNTCQHNWETEAKSAPSCTEAGGTVRRCTLCEKKETVDELPATGHTWTESVREATCTEPGERTKECSACGHKETEAIAPQHSYTETVVKVPTCSTEGVAQLVCSVCGDKQDKPLPKAEHTWKAATGTELKTCTACGERRTSDNETVICDVHQFANISGKQLIALLGKPDRIERGKLTGAHKLACVYYEYNNEKVLGCVSFALVNDRVVRFTSYRDEYKFKNKRTILERFGIREGVNSSLVADNGFALRWRNPSDKVDDLWLLAKDGFLRVTYEMKYYED